ncbi:hypothetical protein [Couchioplanes azureus]|uniref:hypothetical protein n=1 Tax=Couchioplanes caeruleus TaxID=56438 RepID=UPI001670D8B4|nr:hypothetical protein [Couchioplanes caeruleus]GGQ55990.1 hypothetical protein GCM10010166_26760 [Couchioplanes caeruleus subsp. azureus]
MAAPGHDALLISLLAACTACIGYAVGRLHQWYRTGLDRDEAYRDGYETATRSVFSTAARLIGPRRAARGTAAVRPAPPAPGGPSAAVARGGSSSAVGPGGSSAAVTRPEVAGDSDGGRHLVPDELVQAATYRLAPDRVARAKVPGAAPAAAVVAGDDAATAATGAAIGAAASGAAASGAGATGAAGAAAGEDGDTTRLPFVPRPRSS